MGKLARVVRDDWQLVLASLVMPVVAVFFLLPLKPIGPRELEHPPIGRYVEVTFDRIEPLPWTLRDDDGRAIDARFVLGWLGERALVVQTGAELPMSLTYRGELNGLSGEPQRRVENDSRLEGVVYAALLEVMPPHRRLAYGYGALAFSLWLLAIWVQRYRRRNAPELPYRPRNPLAAMLETARPRSDAVVAAVVRKHASPVGFALYFVLYAMLVMAFPAAVVANLLDGGMWATPGRTLAMFAFGLLVTGPFTILPFLAWRRRYRSELARVARDGELLEGVVVAASEQDQRSGWDAQRRITRVEVEIPDDLLHRRFRATVTGRDRLGRGNGVQVLATADDRQAVVVTRDGDDFAARRIGHDRPARFPTARIFTPR